MQLCEWAVQLTDNYTKSSHTLQEKTTTLVLRVHMRIDPNCAHQHSYRHQEKITQSQTCLSSRLSQYKHTSKYERYQGTTLYCEKCQYCVNLELL